VSAEVITDSNCEVCGRRLLPGERPTRYLTREGAEATVCELCRPRAEAAGWLLPEEAAARGGVGRERRRPRGQMLGGLLNRRPGSNGDAAVEEDAPPVRDPIRRRRETRAATASEQPPAAARPAPVEQPPVARGVGVAEALAAFNASNHRRTVAGLSRTLGPPRATALAIEAPDGQPAARLTVAWELTWYQWEISAGAGGAEVRESGKGETIDQLRAPDRAWNLLVSSDGTLERRAAGEAGGE
jgi:hypothetical protein